MFWVLVVVAVVCAATMVAAGRGPVAAVAFGGLAITVFVLFTAVIASPPRPRRRLPWWRPERPEHGADGRAGPPRDPGGPCR
jgi:hypothetical protein